MPQVERLYLKSRERQCQVERETMSQVERNDDAPSGERGDTPSGKRDNAPSGERDNAPIGEEDNPPCGEKDDAPSGEENDASSGEDDNADKVTTAQLASTEKHRKLCKEADKRYRDNAKKMQLKYCKGKGNKIMTFSPGNIVSVKILESNRASTDHHHLPCVVVKRLGKVWYTTCIGSGMLKLS